MLPQENILPKSLQEVKKLLKEYELHYEKIHACVNDCCLFRKENEALDACPKCKSSRWKVSESNKETKKRIPAKILRYFPIIPRFKRMYGSLEIAKNLLWHSSHLSQDGKIRHPVDSIAWDLVNHKWPEFALEPRNLRLGLSADGFNHFRDFSSPYSCWSVMLVTYNFPPWLCFKEDSMMLTLLIPGPKQPGNDIDVYLQPFIEDLMKLWKDGVVVFDTATQSIFNLRAILLWTINDFAPYGNLAGCFTKGNFACPICGVNTCSTWLTSSKKTVYMGHRRFLERDHIFRDKSTWFDGTCEERGRPEVMTGYDVANAVKNIKNDWGKKEKEREM
ncbi:hypothetical protein Scep_009834 [Stephania cephalantha]|uniref:Transposase n=1 Tax=Stephania cephalantha TaxID=152367 RepID=A0AAP0PCU4_9MAGN